MQVRIDNHCCTTQQSLDWKTVKENRKGGLVFDCGFVKGSEVFVENGNYYLHIAEIEAFGSEDEFEKENEVSKLTYRHNSK